MIGLIGFYLSVPWCGRPRSRRNPLPKRGLSRPIQQTLRTLEVILRAAPRGHRWRADAHTTRRESRGITMNTIPVQGDRHRIANFLDLTSGEAMRPKVPEKKVVARRLQACDASSSTSLQAACLGLVGRTLATVSVKMSANESAHTSLANASATTWAKS